MRKVKIPNHLKLKKVDRSWDYSRKGGIAKDRMEQLVEEENITFQRTYQASFQQNAHYQQKFDYASQAMKQSITMPLYSDYTPMQQAIIIAHELGHYFVYKESSNWKFKILQSQNKFLRYWNEYLAWKKARKILQKLKILKIPEANGDFKNIMYDALDTYKPSERLPVYILRYIMQLTYLLFKYWFFAYLSIGLLYIFTYEGVPIPFLGLNKFFEHMNETKFYLTVFITYVLALVIKYITAKLIKKDNKL